MSVANPPAVMFLMIFLLFSEIYLFCLRGNEPAFFVFGLFFSLCLFNFWNTSHAIINSFFPNVILFKENINIVLSFDSINSKQRV